MVRVHPRTGRKCMYYSEGAISHIEGMSAEDVGANPRGRAAHVLRPQFQYRHVWRVGDVVMWDNCSCIHKAAPTSTCRSGAGCIAPRSRRHSRPSTPERDT